MGLRFYLHVPFFQAHVHRISMADMAGSQGKLHLVLVGGPLVPAALV